MIMLIGKALIHSLMLCLCYSILNRAYLATHPFKENPIWVKLLIILLFIIEYIAVFAIIGIFNGFLAANGVMKLVLKFTPVNTFWEYILVYLVLFVGVILPLFLTALVVYRFLGFHHFKKTFHKYIFILLSLTATVIGILTISKSPEVLTFFAEDESSVNLVLGEESPEEPIHLDSQVLSRTRRLLMSIYDIPLVGFEKEEDTEKEIEFTKPENGESLMIIEDSHVVSYWYFDIFSNPAYTTAPADKSHIYFIENDVKPYVEICSWKDGYVEYNFYLPASTQQ